MLMERPPGIPEQCCGACVQVYSERTQIAEKLAELEELQKQLHVRDTKQQQDQTQLAKVHARLSQEHDKLSSYQQRLQLAIANGQASHQETCTRIVELRKRVLANSALLAAEQEMQRSRQLQDEQDLAELQALTETSIQMYAIPACSNCVGTCARPPALLHRLHCWCASDHLLQKTAVLYLLYLSCLLTCLRAQGHDPGRCWLSDSSTGSNRIANVAEWET